MESKKQRYERLKKLLKTSKERLHLCKLELEEAKIESQAARDSLAESKHRSLIRNFEENNILGLNIDTIQSNLIESVYKIINTTPPH